VSGVDEVVSGQTSAFARGDDVPADAVVFERLHPDVQLPRRATEHSAGYDVCAYLTGTKTRFSSGLQIFERGPDDSEGVPFISLMPGQRVIVPLGFKARVPHGVEAQIRIRSSTAFKKGLTMPNAPGTIDADYPDEWLVMLRNDSGATLRIEHGERIAQIVLARHTVLEWVEGEVGITTSRTGGVGSTG
jgi:dUTP pyrophosphatase